MDLAAATALLAEHAFTPGRSSTRDLKPAIAALVKIACRVIADAARPERPPRLPRVSEGRPVVEGARVAQPERAEPAPAVVVGRPRMPEDVPSRGDRPACTPVGTPIPARPLLEG